MSLIRRSLAAPGMANYISTIALAIVQLILAGNTTDMRNFIFYIFAALALIVSAHGFRIIAVLVDARDSRLAWERKHCEEHDHDLEG